MPTQEVNNEDLMLPNNRAGMRLPKAKQSIVSLIGAADRKAQRKRAAIKSSDGKIAASHGKRCSLASCLWHTISLLRCLLDACKRLAADCLLVPPSDMHFCAV